MQIFQYETRNIKKQTREFYKEVCKHKDEVIKELSLEYPVSNSLSQEQAEIIETMVSVAEKLSCDIPTLLDLIRGTQQIEYWNRQLNSPKNSTIRILIG